MPSASGGSDEIENAIALCYKCHADAGHYNPKHPRGTRFKPSELNRHRDDHWAAVAAGRVPTDDPLLAGALQVRHLICLSYDLAKEVIGARFENEHFSAKRVLPNNVSRFMSGVLAEDLPIPRNSGATDGVAPPGFLWHEQSFPTRDELAKAHPELATADERPLRREDFGPGRIRTKLLLACIDAGVSPASIGALTTWYNQCGEDAWLLEYRLRRPLFVFTEVSNRGSQDLTITEIVGRAGGRTGLEPRLVGSPADENETLRMPPIALAPGASLIVPSAVLLSPPGEDDLSFEWVDRVERDFAEIAYTGYTDARGRLPDDAYLKIGPSFEITSMSVAGLNGPATVGSRPLDLGRVYLLGQGWLMGSCPHAVVELNSGTLVHVGEILSGAWEKTGIHTLVMPADAVILHIAEFEFETTTITQVRVNGRLIGDERAEITRGERLSIAVQPGDKVVVHGFYSCPINHPTKTDQVRFKRSLVSAGLRGMGEHKARAGWEPR